MSPERRMTIVAALAVLFGVVIVTDIVPGSHAAGTGIELQGR